MNFVSKNEFCQDKKDCCPLKGNFVLENQFLNCGIQVIIQAYFYLTIVILLWYCLHDKIWMKTNEGALPTL
jgi:hypothetical protein